MEGTDGDVPLPRRAVEAALSGAEAEPLPPAEAAGAGFARSLAVTREVAMFTCGWCRMVGTETASFGRIRPSDWIRWIPPESCTRVATWPAWLRGVERNDGLDVRERSSSSDENG